MHNYQRYIDLSHSYLMSGRTHVMRNTLYVVPERLIALLNTYISRRESWQ